MRKCSSCLEEKPASKEHYTSNKNCKEGISFECKLCNAKRTKKWVTANKARLTSQAKEYHLKRTYSLDQEQFQYLLSKQGGKCAICDQTDWGFKGPSVDHCHKTNEIRGLLCRNCNTGIGHLQDDPTLVQKALEYLSKAKQRGNTKIIGLMGPAASGKTTAAKYLIEKYGGLEYTLAKPLKNILQVAFELSEKQLWGSQLDKETVDPRYNVSPRWLMQHLGTEGFRSVFGEDVWVDYLLQEIEKTSPKTAIIGDVRFDNESKAIRAWRHDTKGKNKQGVVWLIKSANRHTLADQAHASESEWSKAGHDYVVEHDGKNLKTLYEQLDIAYERSFAIIGE